MRRKTASSNPGGGASASIVAVADRKTLKSLSICAQAEQEAKCC
jgi:hypothetical protein